jgi:hypothetical protein
MKKRAKKASKKKKSEMEELSEFIRDRMVTKEYFDEKLLPIYRTLVRHTGMHENHTLSFKELREEVRDFRRALDDLAKKAAHTKEQSKH